MAPVEYYFPENQNSFLYNKMWNKPDEDVFTLHMWENIRKA